MDPMIDYVTDARWIHSGLETESNRKLVKGNP